MKKYFFFLLLMILIAPSIAFASWWNPFSWFKKQVVQPPVVQISVPIPTASDKQIGKEKVVQKKEKKSILPASKKIFSTPSSFPVSGGGASPGVMVGPCPTVGPCTSLPVIINNSINDATSPVVNSEAEQICQKVNGLNPKLLGNLVSEDVVSLATQLQSNCTKLHSEEIGLNLGLIKSEWDSYQQLVNWDKSMLMAFISNPTPDSFRTLCNSADQVKTPFASTKIVLSPDRTSKVLTSVPYTLFDIMMCKDFSEANSTVMAVAPGLLQWDFDSTDSNTLRTKIIDYNDMLKKLNLLENGDVIAVNNTVLPFIDKTTGHLITAKQGELTMTKRGQFNQAITFAVYNPVKWAKKVMSSPAEAMVGTGSFDSKTGFTPLVMHTPPDTIISTFQVPIKS
jgi:hypothetical protein